MQRFQRKQTRELIEAVCWDGTIDQALISWAHNGGECEPNSRLPLRLSTDIEGALEIPQILRPRPDRPGECAQLAMIAASPGDWIVKNARHELTVLSGAAFKDQYERPMHASIKQADRVLLATEQRDLMIRLRNDEWASVRGVPPLFTKILPLEHTAAAELWMGRFRELSSEVNYEIPLVEARA